MGNNDGKLLGGIVAGMKQGSVSREYNVSGITTYNSGLAVGGVLYATTGDEVSLTLGSSRIGYTVEGYEASAGTLSGTANPYTLTMPSANVTINVGTMKLPPLPGEDTLESPYTISNADDWTRFCENVMYVNQYSGQYVKLLEDISVSEMVGYWIDDSDNKPFSGTFLGNNKTINVTLTDDGKKGLSPFRYIDGATIRNLTTAGTISTNQRHSSGLVGYASGTNTIENCAVTVTLNVSSDYAGGIIAHGMRSNTTIKDCVFAGHFIGQEVREYLNDWLYDSHPKPINIADIWGWSTDGTPTLQNCLEKGTYTNIESMHPIGLQGSSGSITNSYYMTPQIDEPTNACSAFVLHFGDDETAGVTTPLSNRRWAWGEAWYTLDGRRLSQQPSRAGVYINNGVKVVIK